MHAFNNQKLYYILLGSFFFCYMCESPEAAGDDKPKSSHLLTGCQSKGKKKKKEKEKTAWVAAGELCPVKTEDVWLRGDSSNSK